MGKLVVVLSIGREFEMPGVSVPDPVPSVVSKSTVVPVLGTYMARHCEIRRKFAAGGTSTCTPWQ